MNANVMNSQDGNFMHYLSHDLREPARMVKQFLTLVKSRNGNSLDKASGEYLDYAIQASNRMDQMIKSIAEVSNIKGLEDVESEFSIPELLEEIKNENYNLFSSKHAIISCSEVEQVRANRKVVKEILSELVTNAICHSGADKNCEIEIRMNSNASALNLEVDNTGDPISTIWKKRAFEPFQKMDTQSQKSGMGLTRLKLILHTVGGKIRFSESKIGGSCVNCTLTRTSV